MQRRRRSVQAVDTLNTRHPLHLEANQIDTFFSFSSSWPVSDSSSPQTRLRRILFCLFFFILLSDFFLFFLLIHRSLSYSPSSPRSLARSSHARRRPTSTRSEDFQPQISPWLWCSHSQRRRSHPWSVLGRHHSTSYRHLYKSQHRLHHADFLLSTTHILQNRTC